MLIAFEGINGVGKTACLGVLKNYLDRGGKTCLVTTSKPTKDELESRGLLDAFSKTQPLDESTQLNLARIFYEKQANLASTVEESKGSDNVILVDRWYISTLVYTLYHDILNSAANGDETEYDRVMKYYNDIQNPEDFDISFLMEVKGTYRERMKKLTSLLMMTTGKKVVVPDVVIYVACDESLALRSNRLDNKIISRYEQEDIDNLLKALYSIVNDLSVELGYCGTVIEYENKVSKDFEESLEEDMGQIFNKIFRTEEETESVDTEPVEEEVQESEVQEENTERETEGDDTTAPSENVEEDKDMEVEVQENETLPDTVLHTPESEEQEFVTPVEESKEIPVQDPVDTTNEQQRNNTQKHQHGKGHRGYRQHR